MQDDLSQFDPFQGETQSDLSDIDPFLAQTSAEKLPSFDARFGLMVRARQPNATPADYSHMGDTEAGLAAGIHDMKSMWSGFLAAAGQATGSEELMQYGLKGMQDNENAANLYRSGRVAQVEDIGGLGDFADYAQYTLGNLAPFALESALSAIAGAVVGSSAPGAGTVVGGAAGFIAKKQVKDAIRNYVKGNVKDLAEERMAKQAIARMGSTMGAFAGGYPLHVGDAYSETRKAGDGDPQAAFSAAVPMALLDSVMPGHVAGKVLGGGAMGSTARRVAVGATEGAVMEGATEVGQEEILLRMREQLDPEFDINGKEAGSRRLNSFVAGALGGSAMGGASSAFERPASEGQQPDSVPNNEPASTDPLAEFDPLTEPAEAVAEEPRTGLRGVFERKGLQWNDKPEDVAVVDEAPKTGLNAVLANPKAARRDARDRRLMGEVERSAIPYRPDTLPQVEKLAGDNGPTYDNAIDYEQPTTNRTDELSGVVEQRIRETGNDQGRAVRDQRMPEGLKDPRLLRAQFRGELEGMAADLVKGGDVAYVRDANDRITGRTPSVNPDWFKALNEDSDTSMSTDAVKTAVKVALESGRMGVRQARVVSGMLDHVTGRREDYGRKLAAERDAVRRARKAVQNQLNVDLSHLGYDPETDAGEAFQESDYLEEAAYADRAIAEMMDDAVNAGASYSDVHKAIENQSTIGAIDGLQRLIMGVRNEHRKTVPGRQAKEQAGTAAVRSGDSEAAVGAVEGKATDTAQTAETVSLASDIDSAASESALSPTNDLPEPTQAQKEAGNYKKGHTTLQGLDIAIENPRDSVRSGIAPDGKKWESKMAHHYGYIKRTEGADGDHVDVFIGDNPESQKVFIVDQSNENGKFDEHKVMLGFDTKKAADDGYHANYEKGWTGRDAISEMSMDEFKGWLKDGDTLKPVAYEDAPATSQVPVKNEDRADVEAMPVEGRSDQAKASPEKTKSARKKKDGRPAWAQELGINVGDMITFTGDYFYAKGTMRVDGIYSGDLYLIRPGTQSGTGLTAKQLKRGLDSGVAVKVAPDPVEAENKTPVTDDHRSTEQAIDVDDQANPEAVEAESAINWMTAGVADVLEGIRSIHRGEQSFDQYRALADAFRARYPALLDELAGMKKQEILDLIGQAFAYRNKNDRKSDVAEAAIRALADGLGITGSMSHDMSAFRGLDSYMESVFKNLDKTTRDQFDKRMDKSRAEADERKREHETALAGMDNPKTLDDFVRVARAKMSGGKSFNDARMEFSESQRAEFDRLVAEKSRNERGLKQESRKTEIKAASQKVDGQIIETTHTKKGHDLFVVQLGERVDREDYNKLNASAKRMGGYYSSFRGGGAVPGFQFADRESAEAFSALLGGDTAKAEEIAKENYDAFADDKKQSAAERLRAMAEAMEVRADDTLSVDRKVNTARRARMAAGVTAAAESEKAMVETMRRLADGLDSGAVMFLDGVRQKIQVEMLNRLLSDAMYRQRAKKYTSSSEQEKHKYEAADNETADFLEFPIEKSYRSDLARLGRQLATFDGAKKISERLLKVADDVTDTYLKFAKENFHQVSTFTNSAGTKAAFKSKAIAEEAIARSGFRGKAITFTVKRGEHAIIMSPEAARERGIWKGDDDRVIGIADELSGLVIEKANELNRGQHRVDVPWSLALAHERRKRLAAMNIKTPAELRAAMREYVGLKQYPKQPSKIQELERSMVGRKNDGLDFFPTPEPVVLEMLDAAEIESGMSLLEPSAGMGHIAERLRESGAEPDVVEFSGDRRELLELKGFNVVGSDFLELNGTEGYDRIVMNPPFSDRRDADHVQHAYTLLKPGGRIVAVMGEGVFFGQDKKAQAFREWFEEVGGESSKLPEGSFMNASLPVTTGVNARIVVINKPAGLGGGRTQKVGTLSPDLTGGMTVNAVESAIARRVLSFKNNNITVRVVADADGLPASAKYLMEERGDVVAPNGYFERETNSVYLVANGLNSESDAVRVLEHEAVGHLSVEMLLGKSFRPFIDRVMWLHKSGDKTVREAARLIASDYGPDWAQLDEFEKGAEIVAKMAELRLQGSDFSKRARDIWTQIVQAVRQFFEGLGVSLNFSDNDVAFVLLKADAMLRTEKGGIKGRAVGAFSKGSRVHSIGALIEAAKRGRDGNHHFLDYQPVSKLEADILMDKTGLDLAGFIHSIDEAGIRHILKEHGNADAEIARGNLPLSEDEIAAIPVIVASADSVYRGGKTKTGLDKIVYQKEMDGTVFVVEEVREKRKKLSVVTIYKKKGGRSPALRATSKDGDAQTSETIRAHDTDSMASDDQAGNGDAKGRLSKAATVGNRVLSDADAGMPIDKVFRKAFGLAGLVGSNNTFKAPVKAKALAKAISGSADVFYQNNMPWAHSWVEAAKRGLIDRYGLDQEYLKADDRRTGDERRLLMQAQKFLSDLKIHGVDSHEEANVLHAVLTGKNVGREDMLALAQPVREAIDAMGLEAVELGLISQESYNRNAGSYLHRSYMKHDDQQTGLSKWANDMGKSRRRKLIGNELKGRGINMEVDTAKLGALRNGDSVQVFKAENGRIRYAEPGADLPDGWRNAGLFEIRRDQQGVIVGLWRDYTETERQAMGEILDARYAIAKTYRLMSHDLSVGRFYKTISENADWSKAELDDSDTEATRTGRFSGVMDDGEWVKVPDTKIPKSQARKWGALAGRYVRAEIWRDLNEVEAMNRPNFWQKMMTQWKLNKTARNPVVHLNNVMSNLIFMDMADVRMRDLYRAIRSLRDQDDDYQDALANGAFGSGFADHELRRAKLDEILAEIKKQAVSDQGFWEASLPARVKFLGKVLDNVWGGTEVEIAGKSRRVGVKPADEAMMDAYAMEDELFRLATYLRRRSLGDDAETAAHTARDQFLNYDIRAPWVNLARQTVLPFIGYTYRAVPVIAKSIAERPWKLAKYMVIAEGINALGYALAPGDEDEERRALSEDTQGYTWLGTPRLLRMPWRDGHGDPIFMDIRRWIPAGDVFDTNIGQSAVPIPAPLQWSGPLMLAAELMLNKQAFTGKEIVNDTTDTGADKMRKVSNWAWKSWMPSAVWVPNSWYWEKVQKSIQGGKDSAGRTYSLPLALSSSMGLKLQPHNVEQARFYQSRGFDQVERALKYELRATKRLRSRDMLSGGEYVKEVSTIQGKLKQLAEERSRVLGGGL